MSSRERILEAADALAREVGAGHMSLDSVARRAGVSKGGLLYHFPSKARLLEALVGHHLSVIEKELERREAEDGGPEGLLVAYLELFLREHGRQQPPSSALMTVLAENPGLLAPLRGFNRAFLDRVTRHADDPAMAVIVFLALQGIRSMALFNVDVLDRAELEAVFERLKDMAGHRRTDRGHAALHRWAGAIKRGAR